MKVGTESPFAGDALSREQSCNDLADFISDAETPYVLAVDAPWGAGKTIFAQMLQAVCKGKGLPTVFFNAWEADFHNDALAAMIGELSGELKSGGTLADAVRKTGKTLLSSHLAMAALKTVAAASLPGAVALAEGVDKALEKFDVTEEYRKRRDALDAFRAALSDYATKKDKPLVFFVDELDRCRPVFAVEVLEKIKHIFSAKGVFFVVSVNKKELGKTIKSVYGEIDADVYLRRFFDRDYPLVNRSGFIASVLKKLGFFEHIGQRNTLLQQNSIDAKYLFNEPQHYVELIAALCDAHGFSLRDCEQVAGIIAQAMMNREYNKLIPPEFVAFFAAMSVADPQRFAQCLTIDSDSQFPFAEWAEYHKKATGLGFEKSRDEMTREERRLIHTYIWLCANRYLADDTYRSQVDTAIEDERRADHWLMSRVHTFAQREDDPFSYFPDPKWVIDAVAQFGKRQFEGGD